MRCKKCDYRLWNLTSRVCPECGTPFKPSDHEFRFNSVQFRCPHCDQAYYGMGEKGHLTPVEFECASCGRRIHMDEMVLLPTAGVEEEQTRVDVMPWLERKRRGALWPWFSTIKMALVQPQRLMQLVPLEGSLGQALWFATFTNTLIVLVGGGFIALIPLAIGLVSSFRGGGAAAAGAVAGLAGAVIVALLVIFLGLLLWGAIAHALLRLTGRVQHSLRRTYQALCFSSGANIFSGIPCLGFYFGWIWWMVSAILMLTEGQRVHGARASFAVLPLPLLGIAAFIGLWVWGISTSMSVASAGMGGGATQSVLMGLSDYRLQSGNRWPGHAIELVAEEHITAFDLVATGSDTQEKDVPVSDTTLDRFIERDLDEQMEAAQAVGEALPDDVIAHRLGDFVFTYHGIDPDTADSGLWLLIMSFDPASMPKGSQVTTEAAVGSARFVTASGVQMAFIAGLADDSTKVILPQQLPAELTAQNALRARHGLAPLPDPSTVPHGKPATASAASPPAPQDHDARDINEEDDSE